MANIIQRYDHFEPSTVILSKMKKNKNGGKTVYINAPENKKLYIQLPFMRSPFGLSAFTDEATNKTSYSLDLSFDTDNEQANDLMEKLKQLDERIVKTVADNSKEWLGKSYNIEVIKEALYKPLVRPGKDDYPSTMKLKLMTKPSGEFIAEAYDSSHKSIPLMVSRRVKSVCALLILIRFGSSTTSLVSVYAFPRFFVNNPKSFPLSPSRVSRLPTLKVMLTRTRRSV